MRFWSPALRRARSFLWISHTDLSSIDAPDRTSSSRKALQLTSYLNLPDELELARAKGELIVFAGAGVSMGAPASLPGFVNWPAESASPK